MAYLRLRLEAERSMRYNLEIVMREAAERVVEICYSANAGAAIGSYDKLPAKVRAEIDDVVAWLRETIEDYFLTLAVADHEESRERIVPLVLGRMHGMTFGERLADYCDKYRNELLVLAGAGLLLGLGRKEVARSICENLRQPWRNPELARGVAAPLSYGRGRTSSMLTAIAGLTTHGIAQGWMRHWELETEAKGAEGWIVRRGSSVACGLCDENCGFHAVEDGTGLPVHLSCCCFAIPIYNNLNTD